MTIERKALFPYVILLAGGLAYANSFGGIFILDDGRTLQDNPRIRHVLPAKSREWLDRGLVDMTFGVNYAINGLNVADYHAVNLAIHLIAALFLYGLIRRTLERGRLPERFKFAAHEIAFVSAAIWVSHPLTTSAVTYVSQRYECMMALFYLMTLYCLVRGMEPADSAGSSEKPARLNGWHALAVVACVAGSGCKEVILTAPIVALGYDWIFFAGSLWKAARLRWRVYAALGIVYALAFAQTRAILTESGPGIFGGFSLRYPLTQLQVIAHYLRLSVWPHPLCADYDWPLVKSVSEALPAASFIGALAIGSAACLRYAPPFGFLGASFFILLAPTSGFLERPDVAFEYRMYLPLAVLIVGVVAGATELFWRLKAHGALPSLVARLLPVSMSAAVIHACVAAAHLRNRDYQFPERILGGAIAMYPDNMRTYAGLTRLLYEGRRYEDAILWSEKALSRLPDLSRTNYASVLAMADRADSRKLMKQIFYYSRIHNNMALVLQAQGRTEEAARHFEEALRLSPGNTKAQMNLAAAMFNMGRTEEAIAYYRLTVAESPNDAAARHSLAEALLWTGDIRGAVENYEAALKLDSRNTLVMTRLAWILATTPDDSIRNGPRAVNLAEDAAKTVSYGSSRALDILAAALAEAGDFDKAQDIAKKAAELADEKDRETIAQRMRLYAAGVAYREK